MKSFGVLIDGDNAQPGIVDELLTEIANYGVASVKRIYGDWTAPSGTAQIPVKLSTSPGIPDCYKSITGFFREMPRKINFTN